MVKHAYSESYLDTVCSGQANLFKRVVEEYDSPDIDQFIWDYMRCFIRERLDIAWPKYATNPSAELLSAFIFMENYEMPRGLCHMDSDMAYWVGKFYAYYQWYWGISSKDLIKWFPTTELGPRYPGLHDKSIALITETWPPHELPCYKGVY